jgi:hypothetical protein
MAAAPNSATLGLKFDPRFLLPTVGVLTTLTFFGGGSEGSGPDIYRLDQTTPTMTFSSLVSSMSFSVGAYGPTYVVDPGIFTGISSRVVQESHMSTEVCQCSGTNVYVTPDGQWQVVCQTSANCGWTFDGSCMDPGVQIQTILIQATQGAPTTWGAAPMHRMRLKF